MPITLFHMSFNLILYFIVSYFTPIDFYFSNLIYLFLADLIDIDHLFHRPIFVLRRNPFKTHFIHKNYLWVLLISFILLFSYPLCFLGIGLISHFFLDFIYTRYWLNVDSKDDKRNDNLEKKIVNLERDNKVNLKRIFFLWK